MQGKTNCRPGLGMDSHSAVLKIKALPGSTVTISKDGVTLAQLSSSYGITRSDDSRFADYYYSIPPAKYGSITIVAELDSDSYTKTVTVDSNIVYDVNMGMKFYLFKNGNQCTSASGGWSASGWTNGESGMGLQSGTVRESDFYVQGWGNGDKNTSGLGMLATVNQIDVTPFSTLTILGTKIGYATSSLRICIQWCGITTQKKVNSVNPKVEGWNTGAFNANINVESISGSYYVVFATGNNANCKASCTQVYLT